MTTAQAEAVPHDVFTASMFDRRSVASQRYVYSSRTWKQITGITLHQTACNMGERLERYDGIGAHFVVTRAGKVLWMHDLDLIVVHGNGWNNRCVGIEIDGLYAGVEGDPRTVWNDPSTPFREVAQELPESAAGPARQLVRWIVEEVRRHGGACTKLVAHRQASKDRRDDPGSAIWQRVALPLHAELGMDDGGVGFTIGDGYPIPEAWDPRCRGIRY